ncbi:MAG: K+/H+ antiporter subunit F [Firmicutes bacterium]|nr:K+/H+ antiporter subunit F [Bacillota bacterium]
MLVIGVSLLLSLWRVLIGPSVPDRMAALDAATANVIAGIVVFAIRDDTLDYIDSALVIALLSFVGTVAVAKFLAKGVIIERDSD